MTPAQAEYADFDGFDRHELVQLIIEERQIWGDEVSRLQAIIDVSNRELGQIRAQARDEWSTLRARIAELQLINEELTKELDSERDAVADMAKHFVASNPA